MEGETMFKQLSGGHLYSDKIDNGILFPVGGSSRGASNILLTIDIEQFEPLFDKIKKNAHLLMTSKPTKEWYESYQTGLDFSVFCHMCAFNNVMRAYYPDIITTGSEHAKFYRSKEEIKLSDVVSNKKCACTEFSILAQTYFQSQNIPTRYVGGELGWYTDNDFNFEEHSYIALTNKGKNYIYDPVNPVRRDKSILPRIAKCNPVNGDYFNKTNSLFDNMTLYYAAGDKCDYLHNLPTTKINPLLCGAKTGNNGK